jgi:hypothetical protein
VMLLLVAIPVGVAVLGAWIVPHLKSWH